MNLDTDRAIDEYLVVLAQGGSRDAMDRLARRWTARLLRYVNRTMGNSQTARDIVQETWIAAIRALPRLADSAQFPAWIFAIAHRKTVDSIRKTQRSRRLAERSQRESETADERSESEATDVRADLSAAIARLSDEQRAVVHLYSLGCADIGSLPRCDRLSCAKGIRNTPRLSNYSREKPHLLQQLDRIPGCGDPRMQTVVKKPLTAPDSR